MPLTAEQSYALGTKGGRDRLNQQLRANPQYAAFLQSIGATPGRLTDQQRKQAQAWVQQHIGPIGGLEIDPAGNLNNPQGFAQVAKQWGPVAGAAAGIAAPFVLPALLGAGAAPVAGSTVSPVLAGGTGATTLGGSALGSGIGLGAGSTAGGLTGATGAGIGLGAGSTAGGLTGATGAGIGLGSGSTFVPAAAGLTRAPAGALSKILRDPDLWRAGGKAAQGYSQGKTQERENQLNAQYYEELLYQAALRDYHDAVVAREQEGRAGREAAWQDLQSAQYLQNVPGWTSQSGRYSTTVPTEGEKSAAKAMEAEVRKRLEQGNPIPEFAAPERFRFDPRYTRAGAGERIAGAAGLGADVWGALSRWL